MILKIRIPRSFFSSPSSGLTPLAAGAAGRGATFSATLNDCMDDWIVEQTPEYSGAAARPAASRVARMPRKEATPGALTRGFSWLQSKYAMTATKRLRVAETVSLGEKRFVALVCVEGREFLIGGGSSGVSLLARLGDEANGMGVQSNADGVEDAG